VSRSILIRTPETTYPVRIGAGLWRDAESLRRLGLGDRLVIATDSNVGPRHAARVAGALEAAGFQPHVVTMPAGEAHKGWASLDLFISGFAESGMARDSWILALGGGVVGDTAGLAAALYMRGLPVVQAPTTLLAMADASVGGKVAIDHRFGKNLVGAFKQPAAVFADLETLGTLPATEIANGMAEVIKAAIIGLPGGGSPLLDLLEAYAAPSEEMVARAVEVKKRLVEADPYETGDRALLNLGHTFGHAFELLSDYRLKHGFGVAQGMMVAARLAERLGLAPESLTTRTAGLLRAYGLPLQWGEALPAEIGPAQALAAMTMDKKRRDGRLRFVLARAVGDVRVETDVPPAAVLAALADTRAPVPALEAP
jgi:3-dehydroquinate synthase